MRPTRFRAGGMPLALVSLLLLMGGPSASAKERPWIELQSQNFLVVSDEEPEEAIALLRDLELFRSVVFAFSNIEPYDSPIPTIVYLFRDRASYAPFRAGRGIVGYGIPTAHDNYIVINGRNRYVEAAENIQQVYTHFLVKNAGGFQYPMWYYVGFAAFLSTVEVEDDRVKIGKIPTLSLAEYELVRLRRSTGFVSFERVINARSPDDFGSRKALGLFFGQCWVLVHYLFTGHLHEARIEKSRYSELIRYLDLVNQGVKSEEAIEQAFEGGAKGLRKGMRKHQRRHTYQVLTIPVSSLPPVEKPSVRRLESGETSRYLGDLAIHLGPEHAEQAQDLFERTLREAPADARALAGLGTALAFQGREGEAREALNRAVAIAPRDPDVRLELADHLMVRAKSADDGVSPEERRALRKEAREHYLRCISLEPDLPAAHLGLGSTYHASGDDPGPGIAALETAHAQLRWATPISLELARLYVEAGVSGKARRLLEEVMQWSQDEDEIEAARELLAEFDTPTPAEPAASEDAAPSP